jgi:hypothetical protein
LNDTGAFNTGVFIQVYCTTNDNNNPAGTGYGLFDSYMYLNSSTTPFPNSIVMTTTPGFYNLFFYACNASSASRGCIFTLHGISETARNGTNANEQYEFILNTNFVCFTNVFITNGSLSVTTASPTGLGGTTPPLNGMTVQLITPYLPLTLTNSNNVPALAYAGCTLLSTTNLAGGGNWQPVVGAPTGIGTNTYVLPVPVIKPGKPSSAIFYMTESASPATTVPTE